MSNIFYSIGLVHRKKDEIVKAHECFTSALEVKRQHYFMDHVSIAETLVELAITDAKRDRTNEAIRNFELALSIYQKSLGAHKSTFKILDALGSLLLSVEQYNKSYRHLERALAMKRILFGNDDEEVSDTLHLIGKVQGKSGDIDDALDSLKEGTNNMFAYLYVHSSSLFNSIWSTYIFVLHNSSTNTKEDL